MSTICPSPTTPTFDLAKFLSGALQIKRDAHLLSSFGTLSAAPEILLNSTSISPVSPGSEGRKRRR
ncbi:unnamed protein product, partial [Strongylus vulgaris]